MNNEIVKASSKESNIPAAIICCFLDSLETVDINSLSITNVIECSSVSRATFYKYFKSKEDLIDKSIIYVYEVIDEEILDPLLNSKASNSSLEKICLRLNRLKPTARHLYRIGNSNLVDMQLMKISLDSDLILKTLVLSHILRLISYDTDCSPIDLKNMLMELKGSLDEEVIKLGRIL